VKTFSCQSGSNGNCIFVQVGRTRLLIDAGISGKRAEGRMAARGQDIRRVDALLLSHDHSDHTQAAGIYQRKFGLPIWATAGTLHACRSQLGPLHEVHTFDSGEVFRIGEATVHTIGTPHDGFDGVCFVIEHRGKRLGILTDLGFVFPELVELLPHLDAVYLESNYDPDMLARGPYPPMLQDRIRGDGGHLANAEAGRLVRDFTDGKLQWVALAHLSEQNNTPSVALSTVRGIVGAAMTVQVASRRRVSDVFGV